MQISRLSVDNLRAIRHLDIDLSMVDGEPRRRVVLLGANGAGKTTILDAIAHAFQAIDASREGFGARALSARDVRDVPPSLHVSGDLRSAQVRVFAKLLDRERRRLRVSGKTGPTEGDILLLIGAQGAESVGFTGASHSDLEDRDAAPALAFLDALKVGFKTPSEARPFVESARVVLQQARPPCLLLAADRGVLEYRDDLRMRDVLDIDPRRGCLSKDRSRFAGLAARLALAWNNERNDPGGAAARMWTLLNKYFPELPRPVHVDGLMLWFKNRSGQTVPLPSLSDGERAILLIFAEIALRAPEDGVILIDEIEQHLHPRWQRAVLEGLSALVPTAQLIVTSQSPYVAATAPDDVVKVGDWDNEGA